MFSILRPYIFNLDPEVAHDLVIKSLKLNLIPEGFFKVKGEDVLETKIFGKNFKNPIGLAAGFDKSAEVYNSFYKIGFGFVEIGTVTPRRQLGNLKPRIFRLEKDNALINRLGFNNDGLDVISTRIKNNSPKGVLGINIGPNKDTDKKEEDYILCLSRLHELSDYITINISSPNTEGLRDFHEYKLFSKLLERLNSFKNKNKIFKPILIKISPDIKDETISNIIELILKYKIDGMIVSNTSESLRDDLKDIKKNEVGGLSGKPIEQLSNQMIKKIYRAVNKKITIIGVGGVDSAQSAFEKITYGASAVQLYTGLIYKGPGVVKDIKKGLINILKKENLKNITQAVGINS